MTQMIKNAIIFRNMKEYVESTFNKDFEKKYYKKFIKITPKGKIIDLGCGVGSASNIFLKAGMIMLDMI